MERAARGDQCIGQADVSEELAVLEERLNVRIARRRTARVGLDANLVETFELGLIQGRKHGVRVRLVENLQVARIRDPSGLMRRGLEESAYLKLQPRRRGSERGSRDRELGIRFCARLETGKDERALGEAGICLCDERTPDSVHCIDLLGAQACGLVGVRHGARERREIGFAQSRIGDVPVLDSVEPVALIHDKRSDLGVVARSEVPAGVDRVDDGVDAVSLPCLRDEKAMAKFCRITERAWRGHSHSRNVTERRGIGMYKLSIECRGRSRKSGRTSGRREVVEVAVSFPK